MVGRKSEVHSKTTDPASAESIIDEIVLETGLDRATIEEVITLFLMKLRQYVKLGRVAIPGFGVLKSWMSRKGMYNKHTGKVIVHTFPKVRLYPSKSFLALLKDLPYTGDKEEDDSSED